MNEKYENIEKWLNYQESPWAKMSYELTEHVLRKHIKGSHLSVLDIGGGNGQESLWLAKEGANVTILDISQNMLNDAHKKYEENGLEDNILTSKVDLSKGFNLNKKYDIIFIHNLFSYLDNVDQLLQQAHYHLATNGILSIMHINRYSEIFPPMIFENDLDKAYEKIDAKRTKIDLFEDTEVYRYIADEMIKKLEKYNFDKIEKYGIMSMCHLIKDNEIKFDKEYYEKLKKLELRLMQEYPYYEIARFNQIIARKKLVEINVS
ncbi:MAG: methyltransferase [Candidatus Delongbacteria bacterium]|jgi:S-adenosylmethionine-dependent methyltransferase|nr:methyltransferase [Candidatus Delongbacteria bacterium]